MNEINIQILSFNIQFAFIEISKSPSQIFIIFLRKALNSYKIRSKIRDFFIGKLHAIKQIFEIFT